jgi:hypothetical protein
MLNQFQVPELVLIPGLIGIRLTLRCQNITIYPSNMPVNRYDQPSEAKFINTYSPVPFDELLKIGMLKQARVDKGQEGMDAVSQAMASIKVAPGDEPAYNNLIAEKTKELEEGLKYGVGSQDQINSVNRVKNSLVTDPRFRRYTYNKSVWDNYVTQQQEASQKNVTEANKQDFQRIQSVLGSGGTGSDEYAKKTGGTGMMNPAKWFENVEVDEGLKKYVDDVVSSSSAVKDFAKDSQGKFIVSSKDGGRSLNALAAPFGMQFVKDIDKKTGKVTLKPVMGQEGTQTMMDFFGTKYGEQIGRDASYKASTDPKVKPNEEVIDRYMRGVTRTINEFVSKNSSYAIDYDPLYEAAARKKIAETNSNPYTWLMAMGKPASKLNSSEAVNTERQAISQQLSGVDAKRQNYIDMLGVMKVNGVYVGKDGKPVEFSGMKDVDGENVDLMLKQFDAEKKQLEKTNTDLENTWRKAVRSTQVNGQFLKEGWKPEDGMTDYTINEVIKTTKRRLNSENATIGIGVSGYSPSLETGNLNFNKLTPEVQKRYDEIYKEEIAKVSPTVRAINKTLKDNAAASTQLVGVTNFPNTTDAAYFEKMFTNIVVEGGKGKRLGGGGVRVRRFDTGEEITDPKELAKFSGATAAGITFDSNSGTAQIVYRPRVGAKKAGEVEPLAPYEVMIDAPQGVEAEMVKAGWTDELELALGKQLSGMENSYSDIGTLGAGEDELTVRKLTPSEKQYAANGVNYEITGKGTDGKTTRINVANYPMDSEEAVVKWYTRVFLPAQKPKVPAVK